MKTEIAYLKEQDEKGVFNDIDCRVIDALRVVLWSDAPEAVARPDIIEDLIWHSQECDDLTLDEALGYLARGWKKVHGRTERQLVLQIVRLLSLQPLPKASNANN